MSEVTRDWDAERSERYPKPSTFRILGEVFTIRHGISPEEFGEKAAPYFEMKDDMPQEEAIVIADDFIIGFLAEADGEERWRAVRSKRNPAVTARDIREIITWIVEEQTGHPPTLPELSQNGAGDAGENSTEPSSSALEASEVSAA